MLQGGHSAIRSTFIKLPFVIKTFVLSIFEYPRSNLGYLAPPGQFFMGAILFIGTSWMRNEGVLKIILVWAM